MDERLPPDATCLSSAVTSRTLVRALARAGLEPAGPLGSGSGGPRLAARDAEGHGWAVTVVGPDQMPREALRARVAALAGLRHPHVARVAPLMELRDGSAVALQAEVVGPDLATVLRARGPWRPGEVVTLVVPLAQALAALHAAGLAHGDVSPGNVVLESDGRPVLVDLVCGARHGELGTPGLAAPERARGAHSAGDVHALGRLGLALLGAAEPAGSRLRAVLEAAAHPEPSARPDAAALAEAVYAAGVPEPVRLPDAAVLARMTLRRLAAPEDETIVRPDLAPASRRARHRRSSPYRAPMAVAIAAIVLGAVVVATGRGEPSRASEPVVEVPPGAMAPVREAPVGGPVPAAARLTVRRADALGTRAPTALASVTVPGSPAAAADRRVAADLWRRAPSPGGVVVDEVHLLALEGARPGRGARARVMVRAHAWVTASAAQVSAEPASPVLSSAVGTEALGATPASVVVLVLEAGRGGWRVSDVVPAPAA